MSVETNHGGDVLYLRVKLGSGDRLGVHGRSSTLLIAAVCPFRNDVRINVAKKEGVLIGDTWVQDGPVSTADMLSMLSLISLALQNGQTFYARFEGKQAAEARKATIQTLITQSCFEGTEAAPIGYDKLPPDVAQQLTWQNTIG